jgi:hypothetical protein
MLAATLMQKRLSAEEADRQAQSALDEIRPAVHFIVDDVNLVAVRPMLMFDVAGLSGGENGASARWIAVGGGVSVTVVTARFEAGYMRTISGPTFEGRRGAAFMRLVFQNLF